MRKKIAASLLSIVTGVSLGYFILNKNPVYDGPIFEKDTIEEKGPCDHLYFDSKFKEFLFQMSASEPGYMYLMGKRSGCEEKKWKDARNIILIMNYWIFRRYT